MKPLTRRWHQPAGCVRLETSQESNSKGALVKVDGTYSFDANRDTVWARLLEPEVLMGCIPGCQEFEQVGEDIYNVTIKVGIGAITGSYTGTVTLVDRDEPTSFKMIVDGKGRGGRVRGEGVLTLTENDGATEIFIDGNAQVSGIMARVGQRLLGSATSMLMRQFFDCMKAKIDGAE